MPFWLSAIPDAIINRESPMCINIIRSVGRRCRQIVPQPLPDQKAILVRLLATYFAAVSLTPISRRFSVPQQRN